MSRKWFVPMLITGLFVAASAAAFPLSLAHAGCGGPNDPNPCPEGGGEPDKKNRPPVEYASFTPTATETETPTSTSLPSATPAATAIPVGGAPPSAKGSSVPNPCADRPIPVLGLGLGAVMSVLGISFGVPKWRRTSRPDKPNKPKLPAKLSDGSRSFFDPDGPINYEEGGHFEWDPASPLVGWVPPIRRIFHTPEGLTAAAGLALTAVSTALILFRGPC
jgi:hypothetical protein